MQLSEIKTLIQRIESLLESLQQRKSDTTYFYENYDDGSSVTWRFANAPSPQKILDEVQTTAVWLWSLKDYLKERLKAINKNSNEVESYVNSCHHLPILADIANRAKHGNLIKSRSGKFAEIEECIMSMNSCILKAVNDQDANVDLLIDNPESISYEIPIHDQNGNYLCDALILLEKSFDEWKDFIKQQPHIRAVL
ncbi:MULTISPECIES: hypothetical protein [Cyanophyceae]|uniref:hypothetical protein n=1 Tax=Cyanophyceae TaxID=3028117 RepID=UPI00168750C5|nr:hypothetical protein [Trichocoleus sp. FACHB-40]MBD2005215.1 hypothetical protein [Trichocoleus sp. FACHB-40]